MTVIKLIGLASGQETPFDGEYLLSFDPEAYGGRGNIVSTPAIKRAKRFATPAEALEFWRKQSKVRPLRQDGKPNRPLTAITIELIYVEEVD